MSFEVKMEETVEQVSIRRCGAEDAQMLATVGAATFLDAFAGVLPGRSIVEHCRVNHSAEKYVKYLADTKARTWVAETATEAEPAPVGYAMVTEPDLPVDDPAEGDVELKRIYLLTRFHKSGAGWKLMQAAMDGAREMGAKRIFLGVFAKNERAIRFYERTGFRVVGERKFQMGFNVFDDYVMGREL